MQSRQSEHGSSRRDKQIATAFSGQIRQASDQSASRGRGVSVTVSLAVGITSWMVCSSPSSEAWTTLGYKINVRLVLTELDENT